MTRYDIGRSSALIPKMNCGTPHKMNKSNHKVERSKKTFLDFHTIYKEITIFYTNFDNIDLWS